MKKFLVACIAAATALGAAGAANAVTFQFKGDGGTFDAPTGNANQTCGSMGQDYCSINHALGLNYSKSGISVTAFGFANGVAARLIQDVFPDNSGIGVLSEADATQDQTQFDALEVIEFVFNQVVTLTNIEFNAGNDVNCSTPGSEGPCGTFDLIVDGMTRLDEAVAMDLLAGGGATWTGTTFRFVPTQAGAGFNIAQFTINQEVPVPGALLLLLTGIGGLSFASRGKKNAIARV